MSDRQAVVVLSTCGDTDLAKKIATALVEARLAACVNIVPQITSVYRWQGKIERENETLLVIKSQSGKLAEIEQTIKSLSDYEVPEVVALVIAAGSEEYLRWLGNEIDGEE